MCPTGKIPYPSPQEAWNAAGHIRRRVRTRDTLRNRRANALHAYRCEFCQAWHTSGTPDPRKRTA